MSTKILKKVNLIRHAQSIHNVAPIFQAPDAKLSDVGFMQAQYLAERVDLEIPYQALIASPYKRAQETADEIDYLTRKGMITSSLFVERKKPSSVEGKPTDDLSALEVWTKWHESFYNCGSTVEDGECFVSLMYRVGLCLDYLAQRPEELIVVVTHGLLIRSIVAYLIIGPDMNAAAYKRAVYAMNMENTGITQLSLETYKDNEPKWVLDYHNDYSHIKHLL